MVHVLRRAVQQVASDATAGALERCLAELGEAMVSADAVAHRVVHGGEVLWACAVEAGSSIETPMGFTPLGTDEERVLAREAARSLGPL